DYINTNLVP
nr:Chain C, HEV-2 [Henipavirus hendraense]